MTAAKSKRTGRPPEFSFCIVSYDSRDYLAACLESLARSLAGLESEILVVDNASTDGTLAMLCERHPKVMAERLAESASYTHAMNRALHKARGRFIVQLNPDTLIRPGVWEAMAAYLDGHPGVGICTPKVLNQDGTLQLQCRRSEAGPWDTFCYVSGLARLFPQDPRFSGYLMTYLAEDEVHACQAVSGSCMVIRREVLERIGFLDETFYAYQEDSDFCFRARQAGFEVYYVPTGTIIHYGGRGGSLVHARKSIYQWHRSYWIYYRRYFARSHFFLVNWLVYLGILVRLALRMLVSLLSRQTYIGSKKP